MRSYQDPQELVDEPLPEHPNLPLPLVITLAIVVIALVYWLWLDNRDYLACICVAGVSIGAISGFRHGFLRMLVTLVSFGLACFFAPTLAFPLEEQFGALVGSTGWINRFLVVVLVGFGLFVACSVVLVLLLKLSLGAPNDEPGLSNWLGCFVGGGQVAAVLLVFFGGLLTMEPLHDEVLAATHETTIGVELTDSAEQESEPTPPAKQSEFFATFTSDLGDTTDQILRRTRESRMAPIIRALNPFRQFPQLSRLQDVRRTVAVLCDPARMQTLIDDPDFSSLGNESEIQASVAAIVEAEEIQKLYSSSAGLTTEKVITILTSPAVLKILDEPEIIARAAQILGL